MGKFFKALLAILIPVALCVGAYYVYNTYFAEGGLPSVNKLIKEKKKGNFKDKDDNKLEEIPYENPLPALREQYGNDEIMGRLQIPNLNIDTPVFRAGDNRFYLNYNGYKQWDEIGVPFFDYRNTSLSTDWQINIYGHNTKQTDLYDKLPLTNLEAYMDGEIFLNYKDVYLSIDEKLLHYEAVATKIVYGAEDNEHMKVIFKDQYDYIQHTQKLLENVYNVDSSAADFSHGERMLVLQICHYDPEGSYLLLICKEKN